MAVLVKIASLVGMTVVVGLLAFTVPTTVSLAKLDAGLQSSLQSTRALVGVQKSVIDKNQSLGPLLQAAQDMKGKLKSTEQVTAQLNQNIASINQLNTDTLRINQAIGQQASESATNLAGIAQNLKALDDSTNSLAMTLQRLNQLVTQDEAGLAQMRSAADQMNSKVPGV